MSDIKEMGGTNGKRSDTYANAFILRERKLHTGALVLVIKTGPALRVFIRLSLFLPPIPRGLCSQQEPQLLWLLAWPMSQTPRPMAFVNVATMGPFFEVIYL
jgi:hypothetical protein